MTELKIMKNFKRTAMALSALIALLAVTGCGKIDNRIEDNEYRDSDFSVQCLHGHKYLMRVTAGGYITPKFNDEGMPEKCGS
jgi:hypothetical protein